MKKQKAEVKEEAVKRVARFIVNGDNTITDQKTGLQIIQDPTLLGDAFKEGMTWDEANKACVALDIGGHKDWRLPTVEELCGMIDRTKENPCYDTSIFKGKLDGWYWTIETTAWSRSAAWFVYSGSGYVGNYVKGNRLYVRPVRSSQCQFDPLFVR